MVAAGDERADGPVDGRRRLAGPVTAVQELDDGGAQPGLVADLLRAAADPMHVPRGRLDPVSRSHRTRRRLGPRSG